MRNRGRSDGVGLASHFWRNPMTHKAVLRPFVVLAATSVVLGLAACGHTIEQKAATGAVAGAVVGGPVGAAVGGAAGTALGQTQKND